MPRRYKMGRARPTAMTAPPLPPQPAAVTAFLRGLDRRARLLAAVQAGDAEAAQRALAVASRVFASDAGQWPLAQWPQQFWRLLLSAPAMGHPATAGQPGPLPGIARLAPPVRAAVLLHLVAGLEDGDAAGALGIDVETYQQRIRDALPRDPLGQPDVDVWRAWRAAVQRELERMPDTPAPAAPTTAASPPAHATGQASERRHRLRWLWLGVAVCCAAMIATFFLHPRGRVLLDEWHRRVHREPLPPAAAPKARFDPADPQLHPDRALLAAPRELQLARLLPLLAWMQATATDAPPPVPASAEDTAGLAERLRDWDRLPPRRRGADRAAWSEWQALTETERASLRATAARYEALPPTDRQALRERYAALPFDAHRGWHLGPQLGRDWPRIVALFAFIEPAQRAPLLQLLRDASPGEIDALARLAQTTPPEARARLRAELLAQPAMRRAGWLDAQLHR